MQHIIAIGISMLSLFFVAIGFLVKRTIFREIDDLGRRMENKVDTQIYFQGHQETKEDLAEIKKLLQENNGTLQKLAIDVAVLKAKEDK